MSADVLSRELCRADGRARTHDDAVREVGEMLVQAGAVTPAYVDAMFRREASISTFMGNGLAIPHGTLDAGGEIRRSAVAVVRYAEPVDWEGNPVKVVIGIAGADGSHLEVLSKIALVFVDEDQARQVADAGTAEELFGLLAGVNAD